MSAFDYVTVGHVTVDVLSRESGSGNEPRPGGGAFYSALQAARLGLRTLILTKGRPRELEELLEPYRGEIELRVLPAPHTTTLATRGVGARRRQHMLAWAGPITEPIEVDTAILHLAAVARETPSRWQGQAEFVGLTPQGLLREWRDGGHGPISLGPLDPHHLPERFDALVISETERPFCQELIAAATDDRARGHTLAPHPRASPGHPGSGSNPSPGSGPNPGVLAVTAGSAPTAVYLRDGNVALVPVPPGERPRDDLGAGDVFAAAFFIALHGGESPADAAAFGNAAAAVRITGVGPDAVGDRLSIDALRMAR